MIDFFIDCVPPTVTAQQKGEKTVLRKDWQERKAAGKSTHATRHFKKKAVQEAEEQFIRWLLPHAPNLPIVGAVRFEVRFIWPWRAADLKKRQKGEIKRPVLLKDTKPDTDNLIKLMKDVMTGCRYWYDDGQVAEEDIRKGWGDRPGIHIRVLPCLDDYVPPLCEEDITP